MGANRPLSSPEAYPSAFLAAIRSGGGVIYAENLPWAPISAAKRFRLLLALIKGMAYHPLQPQARLRWSVKATSRALEVSTGKGMERLAGDAPGLIDAALARAVPSPTPHPIEIIQPEPLDEPLAPR